MNYVVMYNSIQNNVKIMIYVKEFCMNYNNVEFYIILKCQKLINYVYQQLINKMEWNNKY